MGVNKGQFSKTKFHAASEQSLKFKSGADTTWQIRYIVNKSKEYWAIHFTFICKFFPILKFVR